MTERNDGLETYGHVLLGMFGVPLGAMQPVGHHFRWPDVIGDAPQTHGVHAYPSTSSVCHERDIGHSSGMPCLLWFIGCM